MKSVRMLVVAVVGIIGVSCTGAGDGAENGVDVDPVGELNADPNSDSGESALTYHADVRPILESHCTSCHLTEGSGIAPFGLTHYEEVQPLANLIAESTSDRRMPPWPPSRECTELEHPRILSDSEIEVIGQWAADGAPEGDEPNYVAPAEETDEELPEPDLTIDIGTDYKPDPPEVGGIDDYRCFIVEPGIDQDVWLNTHVTRPSNMQVAHHMLMHAVPGDQLGALRERAEQEEGAGYTCFGGPQVSGSTLLGGWVPGAVASSHPPGHGIRIPAGSVFVVQMHYNTVSDSEGTDRTAIDLFFTDGAPERELRLTSISKPDLMVPAGATDDTEIVEYTLPADVDVFGVAPHMHLLGTSTRAWSTDPMGNETCIIDIPRWDFSWQGFYATREPLSLKRGSKVYVECTYDNSPENQPEGRAPRDVRWGDGTYDEMCITYFVVGL